MKRNPMKLPADIGPADRDNGIYISLQSGRFGGRVAEIKAYKSDHVVGTIVIERNDNGNYSLHSYADRGFGPLLYEIAIELNSVFNLWTRSGTHGVSPASARLWDRFLARDDLVKRSDPVYKPSYKKGKNELEWEASTEIQLLDSPSDYEGLKFAYQKPPNLILSDSVMISGVDENAYTGVAFSWMPASEFLRGRKIKRNPDREITKHDFISVSDDPEKWRLKSMYFDRNSVKHLFDKSDVSYFLQSDKYDKNCHTIVAVTGSKVVATGHFSTDFQPLEVAIEVDPNYRRRKIASTIYETVEEITGMTVHPAASHTPYAECPIGVVNFFDLPFFKLKFSQFRHFKKSFVKRNPPSPTTVIKRAKLDGFSGSCLAAAIAINDVVFAGKGKIVAAFNEHQWDKRSKLMGHFAVEFDGKYWDADGRAKPWEEIESWGQIDQFGHGRKLTVDQANNTVKLYFDDSSMTNDYGLRISDVMDIFYNSKTDLVKEMTAKLRGSAVKRNPPSPGFEYLGGGHYAKAYKRGNSVEIIVKQNPAEKRVPFPYFDASKEVMIAVRAAAPERLRKFLPEIRRKRIDRSAAGQLEFIYEMPLYSECKFKITSKFPASIEHPTESELAELEELIKLESLKYTRAIFGFDSGDGSIEHLDNFNLSIHNGVLILRDPISVCMKIPEFMRMFSGNFRRENQVARYLQTAIR